MTYDNRAIGVFDSGLGGLTSVREIERLLPNENIIYFGDTGRVPYGTRSAETIVKYSRDDLRFLVGKSVKAVLVACGTVSSIALDTLEKESAVPIVGVVKPASREAVRLSKKKGDSVCPSIAVLGTPATAKNGAYEKEILKIEPGAKVASVGCPMFVPLVENGYTPKNNPVTLLVAKEYISKLSGVAPSAIILGCTHYPLIRETIESACLEVLGYVPEIVDAGACAAKELSELLLKEGVCADDKQSGSSEFFVSDETHNFGEIASAFLGRRIDKVSKVNVEKE